MSLVLVTKQLLSNIASAIRTVKKTSSTYTLAEMPTEITSLKPYGYTLLGTKEVTANTTSTSATSLDNITISSAWTQAKIIYVRIRDKAGKKLGYFYGSDNWFLNYNLANDSTSAITTAARLITRYTTSSQWGAYTGAYGVYAYDINSSGRVRIYTRYNNTNTLTINGTYTVQVYALEWPDNVNIYDAAAATT